MTVGSEPKARDACGLYGLWGDPNAALKTYYGLFALQMFVMFRQIGRVEISLTHRAGLLLEDGLVFLPRV